MKPDTLSHWSRSAFGVRRAMATIVILFWTFEFGSLTLQRALMETGDDSSFLLPRLLATCVAILLSLAIGLLAARRAGETWPRQLIIASLLAGVAAFVHSLANFAIFQAFMGEENYRSATAASYTVAYLHWYWNYCCITGLLLVIANQAEMGRRARDMESLRGLADASQLAALRYQLSPHFLFNALNSVVSLIGSSRHRAAETLVEDLADFYRAMLDIQAGDEVPLSREIEMQQLYLGVESTRFGDRIQVRIDVPAELADISVPGLILQPLVENAIRHGVSRRDEPTSVAVTAARDGDRVRIGVANDVSRPARERVAGAGIGLANVARRLTLFYGGDCDFAAGPDATGASFLVSFAVPDRRV